MSKHELGPLPNPQTLSRGDEDGALQLGYTADQTRAYALAEVRRAVEMERERCLEMVAQEQVYPSDQDCAILNPAIHRAMRRIESDMTLDDLRREVQGLIKP